MELLITLEFSESSNEFRHNLIEQPTDDFKTVVERIEYSEARRFIDWILGEFEHPLTFEVCETMYKEWIKL
ncbi:MAG TPA: hypothetical protein VFC36_04140 [Paludibacter sp.]|nr:hypothetical protein [Paludibacter sp.]